MPPKHIRCRQVFWEEDFDEDTPTEFGCMHACMIVHVFSRVQLSKEPLTQTTQTKEDTNI